MELWSSVQRPHFLISFQFHGLFSLRCSDVSLNVLGVALNSGRGVGNGRCLRVVVVEAVKVITGQVRVRALVENKLSYVYVKA